jgi:hypothetical protein
MEDFYPVFKDWENQLNDKYVTQWPHKPIHNKPKFLDPTYIPRLEQVVHLAPYHNSITDC